MAFQKSEYKNQYEEQESELAYEFDRPLHGRNYLDEDEKTNKFTEANIKTKNRNKIDLINYVIHFT